MTIFASHAEKIYFILATSFNMLYLTYWLFARLSTSEFAGLVRHRREQSLARAYLMFGTKGYALIMVLSFIALFATGIHLGWYTSLVVGYIFGLIFATLNWIEFTKVINDPAAIAEAKLFSQLGIRVPYIHVGIKHRRI